MTDRPGVDRDGRTELHLAVLDRDAERVRSLLVAGADAGASDDNGWTPLHLAAQENDAVIASLLVAAGAPVDSVDRYGNTPLWRAVMSSRGDGDVIKLLRAHGADPYRPNRSGISPVALARTIANYDIAQYFADLPES